jgi:glutaconate CoA-transferase subunit A
MDKRTTLREVVAELRDGMTVGIGGWGSRRKPMALVREILRSPLKDLTIVSYGGPDVGLLCAAGKVRKVAFGFVSLDSIPREPHFRLARQQGRIETFELDEGMFQWGLYAAANRLPFLPTRAGLGSDVMRVNPQLRTVRSPYDDGEELVAMPAIELDVALIHMNRADARGKDLLEEGSVHTLRINRAMVDGVIETPNGAHFTECPPDYGRDEAFQREYALTAKDPDAWKSFAERYLALDSEEAYQAAVRAR